MNPITIAKGITGLAVSVGTSEVVGNLVRHVTPDEISKLGKVKTLIGTYALGTAITLAASTQINSSIDTAANFTKAVKDNVKKRMKKEETEED